MLNRPWFNDEAVSSIKYHKLLEQFLLDSVVLISKTTPVSKTYKASIHYFNLKKGTLKALVKSKLKLNFR